MGLDGWTIAVNPGLVAGRGGGVHNIFFAIILFETYGQSMKRKGQAGSGSPMMASSATFLKQLHCFKLEEIVANESFHFFDESKQCF